MSDTSMPATGFRLLVSGRNTPMYEIRWLLDLESRMLLRSPTFKKTLICAPLRKASSVEEQRWDDANGTSHHSACLGPRPQFDALRLNFWFKQACSEAWQETRFRDVFATRKLTKCSFDWEESVG